MRIHPSFESLIAYRDGELDEKSAGRVALHLADCATCRRETDRIGREREQLARLCRDAFPAEVPPFNEVFANIMEMAGAGNTAASQSGRFAEWRPARALRAVRTPLFGLVVAVLFLMGFNTVVFTGLLLHPLYSSPSPRFVPFSIACMVPAYLAARRLARMLHCRQKLV
jgi:anti-sigma factor RsiW